VKNVARGGNFSNSSVETSNSGWRKLHKDEMHDLYSSTNIIQVLKSRKMRWVGHVA
jgi:hypothetical protein